MQRRKTFDMQYNKIMISEQNKYLVQVELSVCGLQCQNGKPYNESNYRELVRENEKAFNSNWIEKLLLSSKTNNHAKQSEQQA